MRWFRLAAVAALLAMAYAAGLAQRREVAGPALAAPGGAPDFSAIARLATPAVVNISATQVVRAGRSPFTADPFFREFFGGDLPFRIPSEERRTSLGSGVLVSAEGLIVTNNHVVERARQIAVTLSDGRRFRAALVGTDPATDIAVIRVESKVALPSLRWGDSSKVAVGEYALAIGNPFQLSQTVTMGIISAIGRSNVGIADYEDFIQTDAAINPGNSGGALVNVRGELIGINTAIYSETGGYMGIGFAVPAALARHVAEQIERHGRVRRGFVGITRIAAVEGPATGATPPGAVVLELLRGSPADRAGLEPGDVILAVDGKPVAGAPELRNLLAEAQPGARLRLGIDRAGQRAELRIDVDDAQ
ncbi:MAG: trypsin-like peptidase domain-containing protein [Vicinamibacteria bacterium]|nr:trypsin-like peptidase domain-containing protein [Vicinamibacteria bacterium]